MTVSKWKLYIDLRTAYPYVTFLKWLNIMLINLAKFPQHIKLTLLVET